MSLAEYYTPEQIAQKLAVTPGKVNRLIDRKLLGCSFVGRSQRISAAQVAEYMRHAASRPPKKNRSRPLIPAELGPVWERLTEIALASFPHLAPSMQQARLASIETKARIATVIAADPDSAAIIMAERNRYALQRCLRTLFLRPLMIRTITAQAPQNEHQNSSCA
jgi:excisionase family DNA binding protein